MKNVVLYLGIAMIAAAGIVLWSPRRTREMEANDNIRKLQEKFKKLDAL